MAQPEGEITQPTMAMDALLPRQSGKTSRIGNRGAAVSAALLVGEVQELVRKAAEVAKAGDTQMRVLPRDRAVRVELPKMEYADELFRHLLGWRIRHCP